MAGDKSHTGWSGGDPDDFTSMTLIRTSLAMRRVFVATLAPFDLPPHHFSVLMHLVEQPGLSQADLARVVLATPQSVGELLRVMEHKGLVERTAPAGRGLPSAVYASKAGRDILDAVTPHVKAAFAPEALGLDEATYRRLNVDLHAVLEALGP
ncbi:MarR family winged helix-turn-helix transcriptional regulator [Rhodococcoides yunnanense]|uniref:MarR family winged helix-turn-helix transcriptional regulator n=1 Tax=Rhodococcoides yunnanense TaxID=278209 RepID=A0ABU4BEP4_9NOCA|nr:MarR family winged helix-turn-helix transcriptional regulator [Rhodococcus yunnanensis]MDV6262568.1 MarR family winged helix-turn-helix transcriptional regulator [Rhodococcus yunnanensis]